MELKELRSFCAAANLKSISRAAEQLAVGQPVVTTHIRKLEKEIGTTLFDRVRRPIQLTLPGRALLETATPLLQGLDQLLATTLNAQALGPVTLGCVTDIVPHTLLRVVKVFLSSHPHVSVRIKSGSRTEILKMVNQGEVDPGIIQYAERGEQFNYEPLFLYERVLITPRDHPLLKEELNSLDQIAAWPLILMASGTSTRSILEAQLKRTGASYEVIIELDSMDMIKRYVSLGMGVSVGPRFAIEPEDEQLLGVVSLANLLPVDQAGIVSLPGKALSDPAQEFMAVMRQSLQQAPTRNRTGQSLS